MDLLCIMWKGHPFLSIRADGNITIKHRANLMLAFIAVLPPQQKYMNVESMSLIFESLCVWDGWVGRYHIEMGGTQITSQKGAFVCWTPHLSQSVEMGLNREATCTKWHIIHTCRLDYSKNRTKNITSRVGLQACKYLWWNKLQAWYISLIDHILNQIN